MTSRISARIALGTIAATLLGVAALGGGVSYMAKLQDKQSDLAFRRSVNEGMDGVARVLNLQTTAFAAGSGVFDALASRHADPVKAQAWLDSNLGGKLIEDGALDFVAVFDQGYAPVYAWEPCLTASNPSILDDRFLKSVTPHLAVQPDGKFSPITAYALLGGKPVLYSFTRVYPLRDAALPADGKFDYLMTGKYVNQGLLAETGRNRSLEELRFAPVADGRGVALADGGGKPVGQLRWNDRYPGSEALRQAAVPLIACGMFLLGAGGFAGYGAHRMARRLEADEAEARKLVHEAGGELLKLSELADRARLSATAVQALLKPLADVRTSVFLLGRKLVNRGLGVEQQLERIERDISHCESVTASLADCHLTGPGESSGTVIDSWLAGLIEDEAAKLDPAIEVVCELGLGELAAPLDQARMRRVLANLMACAAAEALALAGGAGGAPRVTVRSKLAPAGLEISVSGHGAGFNPHPAADQLTPDLRLPAARNLLELQGGALVIGAQPGGGTVYAAHLPLAAAGPLRIAGVKSAA